MANQGTLALAARDPIAAGSLWRRLPRSIYRRLRAAIYQQQVKMYLSRAQVLRVWESYPATAPGLVVKSCDDERELAAWVELLNREEGFGVWSEQRLRTDLLDMLVSPRSTTLVYDGERLIGCACLVRVPGDPRTAQGMFMYLDKAYRGSRRLGHLMALRTLAFVDDRPGLDRTLITTDPERLSALLIYLQLGAEPIRDSLYAFVQWRRIYRRLGPVLQRMAQREGLTPKQQT